MTIKKIDAKGKEYNYGKGYKNAYEVIPKRYKFNGSFYAASNTKTIYIVEEDDIEQEEETTAEVKAEVEEVKAEVEETTEEEKKEEVETVETQAAEEKECYLTSEQWERVYHLSKKANRNMEEMIDEIYDYFCFYDDMDKLLDDYEKEILKAELQETAKNTLETVNKIVDELKKDFNLIATTIYSNLKETSEKIIESYRDYFDSG